MKALSDVAADVLDLGFHEARMVVEMLSDQEWITAALDANHIRSVALGTNYGREFWPELRDLKERMMIVSAAVTRIELNERSEVSGSGDVKSPEALEDERQYLEFLRDLKKQREDGTMKEHRQEMLRRLGNLRVHADTDLKSVKSVFEAECAAEGKTP